MSNHITSPPQNDTTNTDPKLAAIKTRISTHMTADHADSLALFLRHYSKQPIPLPPIPNTLQLTDLSSTHLIITHPQGRSLIPLNPPLSDSLSDARPRLIQMHNDCLTALDLSPIHINTFFWPNKVWQYLTHFAAGFTFLSFTLFSPSSFLQGSGSIAYTIWSFGGLAPWHAWLASVLCRPVLLGMVLIHGTEVVWFERTRLRKFWIERWSGVWWAWVCCVFVGGVAGQWRFDEMVEGIKEERERKGKH